MILEFKMPDLYLSVGNTIQIEVSSPQDLCLSETYKNVQVSVGPGESPHL